ncbi:cytochrome c oxidase assembly factor 6 homolog isoform X1 [Vulpes lagopus]|uniref:cytochrome c oxidase assembly factor 6 homolog isoform X1 n=1 Tax=Vulpes lagopus TaxID=494514 RepID=UPI001BCA1924|nr:cytochrome c oxidase assembly factor 6 homolog isoform X1 [Vulpes lagopus]
MAAPSMKERQACWGARDEYWRCLDDNTEDASRCEKLRSSFEARCPQQWAPSTLQGLGTSSALAHETSASRMQPEAGEAHAHHDTTS